MNGLMRKALWLLRDESGQSTTEYILILAVVVMIAMKFKDKIGTVVNGATDSVGGQITTFTTTQ